MTHHFTCGVINFVKATLAQRLNAMKLLKKERKKYSTYCFELSFLKKKLIEVEKRVAVAIG